MTPDFHPLNPEISSKTTVLRSDGDYTANASQEGLLIFSTVSRFLYEVFEPIATASSQHNIKNDVSKAKTAFQVISKTGEAIARGAEDFIEHALENDSDNPRFANSKLVKQIGCGIKGGAALIKGGLEIALSVEEMNEGEITDVQLGIGITDRVLAGIASVSHNFAFGSCNYAELDPAAGHLL